MAFKKYGDPQPVGGYYDEEADKPVICDKCGQPKTIVAMDNEDNKIICECELGSNDE